MLAMLSLLELLIVIVLLAVIIGGGIIVFMALKGKAPNGSSDPPNAKS